MSTDKDINVVFDTRFDADKNKEAWESLINQVNAVLQSGKLYHLIEITKWTIFDKGEPTNLGLDVHIPLYRHFYHDPRTNTFGGGFMLFEIMEDLRRYYPDEKIPSMDNDDFDITYTITITVADVV